MRATFRLATSVARPVLPAAHAIVALRPRLENARRDGVPTDRNAAFTCGAPAPPERARAAATCTVTCAVAEAPDGSFTVTVTTCAPGVVNTWETFGPPAVPPSPKFHA